VAHLTPGETAFESPSSASAVHPGNLPLERVQLGLIAAIATTCLVSVFAAEVFLTLATVVYLVRLAKGQATLFSTRLDAPMLAFAVWTLLSASFSQNPLASHQSSKKLVLFAALYLAIDSLRTEEDRTRLVDAAILGGLALGLSALSQRYFLGFDTINHRPQGFLGHYMTCAGCLMVTVLLATSRLAFLKERIPWPDRRDLNRAGVLLLLMIVLTALKRLDVMAVEAERLIVAGLAGTAATLALSRNGWPGRATSTTLALLALPVCLWALVVSQTRSAWLGTIAGLALVAVLKAPRTLGWLAAGLVLLFLLRPAAVRDRLTVTDASSVDRIYMWQAGMDMIRDKPIFGQGPDMILRVYPDYRWAGAPNPRQPHLHDNALQIAAERGLPCLAWWLWWVAVLMAESYRISRREDGSAVWGVATLTVLAAVMVEGLFEYNFADSEILILVLVVSALPFTFRDHRSPA
jgi:O-antigen ligase